MNTDDSNTSIELKELQSNPLTKVYDEILTSPGSIYNHYPRKGGPAAK